MAIFFDSWVTEMLAILSTVFAILYVTFKISYTHWKKKGLPYLEPSFPLGNAWNTALMRKSLGEDLRDVYFEAEGKHVVGIYSLHNPILVVRDPELIKTIFVKDFNYFPDRGVYVDEKTDPLSAHLFFQSGSKWKSSRQKLSPTFTSGKNARHVRHSARLCAFGIDVDSQHIPNAEFRQWGRRFFKPSLRTFLSLGVALANPKLRTLLPIPLVPKDIAVYFTQIVKDTVRHREGAGVIRKDFIQLMVQLKNNGYIDDSFSVSGHKNSEQENGILTSKEMAAQAWGFFLGGFETSSGTVSFCLYELARHLDIQKKLQEEIDEVMKKTKGDVTYEDLMTQMPYLEKVVNETLRLHPPAQILNREVAKDYKLPGYDCVLETGTKVIIPVMGLHHDRKFFRNPEKFDTEHFSEEQVASRHTYSFLPFGEGPRICIGMRFGLMQMKMAIVYLLSKFVVLPVDDKPVRMDPSFPGLTPIGGMNLRFERRQEPAW
ncbi:cytochrome P450 6k1-like [Schistocerca piceifrons]|uniref:cytochrome P450 6k1-like n=1 Tax=Schistocerca piceifrons TaxID=274613 RepID=UPI001F5E8AD9|nr:cytochrome P450 6k1-like [Schistocerca piceifrons]